MSHDRGMYLTEALRSHIDSFGNSAEQLRCKIEASIQSIGSDFWKHNTEKTEAITKSLEKYTSGLGERVQILLNNIIDAYKEARSRKREVSDAFVLLRGLLHTYSNLFLYAVTAPIIDVTSFSPPRSPVIAVRSHLRQLVSEYNGPDISLPELNVSGVKQFIWDHEKLKPDPVSIQALFSGKEGPLAIKNTIIDSYLNDTKGIYNMLFQTLIRDHGEDVAPYPSSLVDTASRLLDSKGMNSQSPHTNLQISDKLLYNQRKYLKTKLKFHEHVLSSYYEIHLSLEDSLKVYNSSIFRKLHTRTTLSDEHRLLKQAMSFIHQGEYTDMSSVVSALESCISSATSELPQAILLDSSSFSAVSILDARLQTQTQILALIKKQINLHTHFDILELERSIVDIENKLRQLDAQLKLSIPEVVQHLEDHLMVEVGVCTSMGNKDSPARRIVDALQRYRLDPDTLLQEYVEVSLSVKAMEYYLKSLLVIAQPGDEDHQYVVHLLQVFGTYFDNALTKLINSEDRTSGTKRCNTNTPLNRLETQYKLLHDLSLLTAVSIASGSLLSSFQKFDKGLPIPGLKEITPNLFMLTSHRQIPTSALLQEADLTTMALRPLIEPHGILSHALHSASETIHSAGEGTRVLSAGIFNDNRSARLADLSRAYAVRNKMRLEDMLGKIRRCFDVHNKAVMILNSSTADLLGQKVQTQCGDLYGSLKDITLKTGQLTMQSELSTIEKFIKSRKHYSAYLEELCQESKKFTSLGDEIAKIIESHNTICDRSLEVLKQTSNNYAEQLKELWNEGILKYDQLTQTLHTEVVENRVKFTDMKALIEPCLMYSQFPPSQNLVSSICAPFINENEGVIEGNEAELGTKKTGTKTESAMAIRVPMLSPTGKNSISNTLRVAKALDTATKGSLFYGIENGSEGTMESVYMKLHFSLRHIEFAFEEGSFSLNLGNVITVYVAPSTLTCGDNEYYCLILTTPQTKYEVYARDRSVLQAWVCSLKNILAYGKDIKSLRSIWLASSKENVRVS
ncbi:Hypothetical protein GLP15_4005 [Giardia lamblia P15]|uniref:PH domain-containing protein n=1 Tax=Giardia intestinalis (strain P15) TaxID=658858 RepID=E1F8C6_GIAIA|nr:Hypothetical protein GLP15_4005 [Giardia lamblia P15]